MKKLFVFSNLLRGQNPIHKFKIILTSISILLLLSSVSESMGYFYYDVLNNDPVDSTALNIKIAKAYGIDAFSKVKKIEYTFNVEFNGKKFNRKWEWFSKTKDITYWGKDSTGKDITLSYNQNKSMDSQTKKIDAQFINDNYWMLFPFHLAWDNNVTFKDEGMKKYPINKGEGRTLMVKYSNKVGYTPGDAFELYLDKSNKIKEWIYFNGGNTKHPGPATWEGNKDFNGITISTMHYGPGKKFKLFFSDINVEYEK